MEKKGVGGGNFGIRKQNHTGLFRFFGAQWYEMFLWRKTRKKKKGEGGKKKFEYGRGLGKIFVRKKSV